ncbi:contractile injection system protein, VgrG/Pvc8 family [Qipengyuania citrea]|uniref:contractile injection system protein, VgrG/Pvc8 family n=1 Tax=Qipengyuania citrea TaxID=225971 RepID=UPI0020A0BD9D|nr:contractile injection system protein, VgrG/Pvc8 family [Qipengyuania citrea]MCP2016855.1 phage protein D [Qipengyuania citrea]
MTVRQAALQLAIDGGADLTAKVNPRLVDLTLSERREDDADELNIALQNADGQLAIPDTGKALQLALGWASGDDVPVGMVDKGRFIVDEVGMEGPPDVVTIRARSADLTDRLRQRRTKSWKDTTLGAILQAIAGRHGRTAQVDGALAGIAVKAIEQEGKSDMAFIRDLGRRHDAIATWKDGKLLFLPIGKSASASGAALASVTLAKRDGWRWSFRQADRDAYDGAEAQWHDQDAGKRRTVQTGGGKRRKLKRVYASEAEARKAAEGAASRAARKPFSFTYDLAIADPALQPDMRVKLNGWGEKIDAIDWLVKTVETRFGAGGLRQSIEMESA